jgi:predicted transcriptional regulator
MSQTFLTPMGTEILFLLNGSGRSLPELFSLLRYDEEDIRRCIKDLSQKWLINRADEKVSLTLIGHLLANKIRTTLPAQYGGEISPAGEGLSADHSDWVLDTKVRENIIRDIFISNPWLEILPDQPLVSDDGNRQQRKGIAEESCYINGLGEGDTLLDDLFRTTAVIQRFGSFFMVHAIETLPPQLADRLGDLYHARLMSDIPVDFKQDFDYYIEIIRQAERVRGVSTWATSRIAFEMGKRILHGADIELIITRDLAGTLLLPPYRQIALKLIGLGNIRFRISLVPVEVGLTVTNRHLSLGFFTRKGHHYDSFYDLVCTTPRARAWGEELFHYYQRNSIPADDYFTQSNRS